MRKNLFKTDPRPRPFTERFWEKANILGPDDCWLWMSTRHKKGYGHFTSKGKCRKAHRVAYELTHGSVPEGLMVCHRCDTPSCVNPKHLYVADNYVNQQDSWARGVRGGAWTGQFGEASPNPKLTEDQAKEIISMRSAGLKQKEIAKRFGIHQSTVSDVVTGRCWKHLVRP